MSTRVASKRDKFTFQEAGKYALLLKNGEELALSFSAQCLYGTGLGCHMGAFTNVCVYFSKDQGLTVERYNLVRSSENGLAELVIGTLVHAARTLKSHLAGDVTWPTKSHFVLSTNFNTYRGAKSFPNVVWKTADIIEMLVEYCEAEPKKYGYIALTPPSECMAHPNGANTISAIWTPPYTEIRDGTHKTAFENYRKPYKDRALVTW